MLEVSLGMREFLNRQTYGLSGRVDDFFIEEIAPNYSDTNDMDTFTVHEIGSRYIKMSLTGITYRFNFNSKEDIVNKEAYWLSKRLDLKTNYTNAIKHKYTEEPSFYLYVMNRKCSDIDWSYYDIPDSCWLAYEEAKKVSKDFTLWNGELIKDFTLERATNTYAYILQNKNKFTCQNVFLLPPLKKVINTLTV